MDAYIAGQEWSVTYTGGVINGYAGCGATSWNLANSPYSAPFTSGYDGCVCSLDKQNWYSVGKVTSGSTREEKIDYCRANCPKECAARFANNTDNLRTIMLNAYGSCPIVSNQSGDTISLTWYNQGQSYASTTCTVNGTIELPIQPTREGYSFAGWKLIEE